MNEEMWLVLGGIAVITAMVLFEYVRRDIQALSQYRSAVRFQLGAGRQQLFSRKRVNHYWKCGLSAQTTAWKLINENQRFSDRN